MALLEFTLRGDGDTFSLPKHIFCLSDGCLDAVALAWGVHLTQQQRDAVRGHVHWRFAYEAIFAEVAKSRRDKRKDNPSARRKKVGRIARLLVEAIEKGGSDLEAELAIRENTYLALLLPQIKHLLPRDTPPQARRPNGRPPITARNEEYVVALARICLEAGGRPSASFSHYIDKRGNRRRNAFWEGIATIHQELLPWVRLPSVNGLAEKARKARWLSKLRPRGKPQAKRRTAL